MNKYTLLYFTEQFPDEQSCRDCLEKIRWNNKPVCPHCGNSHKIYRYNDGKLFKCSACGKRFQVTTGMIYHKSKIPLRKWFLTAFLLTLSCKGISSVELSKVLGITQKSAWYLLSKVRFMLDKAEQKRLSGTVEVDEMYYGPRKPRIKGSSKRGRGTNKTAIFGAVERSGNILAKVVPNTKSRTLMPIIRENVELGTIIMSDEYLAYNQVYKHYKHETVNHGSKEYARGDVHVNSIEGAWSHLRRTLIGTYHRPSKEYLDKYVKEFIFNYNNRNNPPEIKFRNLINLTNVRVQYKDITPHI